MEQRFVRGGDDDFDYGKVDDNEEYDDRAAEELEAEEQYFDQEEPHFVAGQDAAHISRAEQLQGETGIQDF